MSACGKGRLYRCSLRSDRRGREIWLSDSRSQGHSTSVRGTRSTAVSWPASNSSPRTTTTEHGSASQPVSWSHEPSCSDPAGCEGAELVLHGWPITPPTQREGMRASDHRIRDSLKTRIMFLQSHWSRTVSALTIGLGSGVGKRSSKTPSVYHRPLQPPTLNSLRLKGILPTSDAACANRGLRRWVGACVRGWDRGLEWCGVGTESLPGCPGRG